MIVSFKRNSAERRAARSRWHKWFAWRPVTLDLGERKGSVVWMERIERKYVMPFMCFEDIPYYRPENCAEDAK